MKLDFGALDNFVKKTGGTRGTEENSSIPKASSVPFMLLSQGTKGNTSNRQASGVHGQSDNNENTFLPPNNGTPESSIPNVFPSVPLIKSIRETRKALETLGVPLVPLVPLEKTDNSNASDGKKAERLTVHEQQEILHWLDTVEGVDLFFVRKVFAQCAANPDTKKHYLMMARGEPTTKH